MKRSSECSGSDFGDELPSLNVTTSPTRRLGKSACKKREGREVESDREEERRGVGGGRGGSEQGKERKKARQRETDRETEKERDTDKGGN